MSDIEQFFAAVQPLVERVLTARGPWDAYHATMDVASAALSPEWEGKLDFDGRMYTVWMELSDLYDKPWYYEHHDIPREQPTPWCASPPLEWLETPDAEKVAFLERWDALDLVEVANRGADPTWSCILRVARAPSRATCWPVA